jgi:phosphatidylglycerophosphate synthase
VNRHVPNLLSGARIPASLAILAIYDRYSFAHVGICLLLVVLVMTTDILDGWIARRFSLQSKFGYMLDGLGDRAFHIAAILILVMDGVLFLQLAWILIFREISQYAVRIVESDWHSTQSRLDRVVTRTYAVTLQGLLFVEMTRAIVAPSTSSSTFSLMINIALSVVAAMSFSRITPRLLRAWRAAVDG